LKTLSNLCEPVKIYSRNKAGTEYKTFSPFTLFADACIADAKDAVIFNKLVAQENYDEVKIYLKHWSKNYDELQPVLHNPNVHTLGELSKNLSITSNILLNILTEKEINTSQIGDLKASIALLEKPYLDVELAVVASFKNLIILSQKKYSIKK
jgi:hexosaminidase